MENQRLKEGTGQRDAGKDKDRGESFLSANYERIGVPSRPGHEGGQGRARTKGHYVRKPRQEYREVHHDRHYQRFEHGGRKRGPRQYWVAKNDPDKQTSHEGFIRDTRRKTATVFNRISDPIVSSADPEDRGRRTQ